MVIKICLIFIQFNYQVNYINDNHPSLQFTTIIPLPLSFGDGQEVCEEEENEVLLVDPPTEGEF